MNKLTIKLPFIYNANDYHCFDDLSYTIGEISGKEPKYIELDSNEYDGLYWAVFYIGKKPDKKIIDKLYKNYRR